MKMTKEIRLPDDDDGDDGVLAGDRFFHEGLDWLVENGFVEMKGEDEDGKPFWGFTELGEEFMEDMRKAEAQRNAPKACARGS
jgi:hypothetical protein